MIRYLFPPPCTHLHTHACADAANHCQHVLTLCAVRIHQRTQTPVCVSVCVCVSIQTGRLSRHQTVSVFLLLSDGPWSVTNGYLGVWVCLYAIVTAYGTYTFEVCSCTRASGFCRCRSSYVCVCVCYAVHMGQETCSRIPVAVVVVGVVMQ